MFKYLEFIIAVVGVKSFIQNLKEANNLLTCPSFTFSFFSVKFYANYCWLCKNVQNRDQNAMHKKVKYCNTACMLHF